MTFCWCTIKVRNMEESLRFYQEIIGLEVDRRFKAGSDMEIVFLGKGETKVELICDKNEKNVNIGQDVSIGFEVDSIASKMEFIKNQEIDIHSGPFEPAPNVKFFYVLDPNGLKIQFVQNK